MVQLLPGTSVHGGYGKFIDGRNHCRVGFSRKKGIDDPGVMRNLLCGVGFGNDAGDLL